MDILGQSALLVGVTSFSFGLSTLSRNVKNKLFISFAVLTAWVSGWALCFFMDKVWPEGAFYRWHLLCGLWLAPSSLGFIRLMVRIQDSFSRRLFDFSFLLAALLTVALIFHFDADPGVLWVILFSPCLVLLQIFELMWIDRRLRRGLKRFPKLPTVGIGRRNLIYLGGILALSLSQMDHVPQMGTVLPSLGNLLLVVYLFFISQAISHQRLLNFGALVSRILVLTSIALTLTGVYYLLVAWIQNSPGLFFLNSFIASFLILSLLEPLRSVVRYFTERLLTQKHLHLQKALREAQRDLAGTTDPGSLFQNVLMAVEKTIQPKSAALFVLRSDGTRYRRVRILGEEPVQAIREILFDHALLHYCLVLQKKGELPIVLDQLLENEMDRTASVTDRERVRGLLEALRALHSNLLIPILHVESSEILGFIALDAPVPPEPWGNNWGLLTVIYPYFEQVAQTMRSLDVYVKSREKERLATLGQMAAGLAHEIRNPLGAIKGAAQFLDPAVDRPESRFLHIIIEEVERLNRVVTRFLDYSKPPTLDFQRIDLSALAERTVELMRPGLSTDLVWVRGAPVWVQGAAEQLQQVLINFIQNSAKAIQEKELQGNEVSRRIQVTVEREGGGKSAEAFLSVEDQGIGIKKENFDKLFIPFFTTSPSGTGLGLSISQKIVEAHRGRIEVSSEEGRFTRFSVVLSALQPIEDQVKK